MPFPRCARRMLHSQGAAQLLHEALHTSPRRCSQEILLAILAVKYLGKMAAVVAGRRFQTWWSSIPESRQHHLLLKHRLTGLVAACAFTGGLTFYYFHNIRDSDLPGKRHFLIFSPSTILEISDRIFTLKYADYQRQLLPASHPVSQRINSLTYQIISSNSQLLSVRSRAWRVYVVNSPVENALALPNGKIFIFRGLMPLFKNDSDLGGIIAHEISHAILFHGAEQISLSHFLDLITIPAIFTIWAGIRSTVGAAAANCVLLAFVKVVFLLPLSRRLELEADRMGVDLAARACLDVREISGFWMKMWLVQRLSTQLPTPEWLSTHPPHLIRAHILDVYMPQALQLRELAHCPPLPSSDPRNHPAHRKNAQ